MQRIWKLSVCLLLVFFLAGCNFWTIIWDGIAGKGYYQTTRSTIAAQSGNLSATPISLGAYSTSAVIVYKTNANGYYGKLSYLSVSDTSLVIQFVTYANDGTAAKSSNSTTIAVGESINLETGGIAGSAGDFTFAAGETLTPANAATFYVYSK